MATISLPMSFSSVSRGAIRDVVARRLLTAIIRGEIPAGQRMIVQRMVEQMGVSATPIREALFELASIGIVDTLPNRGAVMREFGPTQLREIYQLRRLLEVEAVRGAIAHVDRETLREMERELESLSAARRDAAWSRRTMELDVRLHELIAAACGSTRLQHELARYNSIVQVVREVVDNELHAQERAIGEHLEIIRQLLTGDAASAAAAMARHIESTAKLVEDAMFPEEGVTNSPRHSANRARRASS